MKLTMQRVWRSLSRSSRARSAQNRRGRSRRRSRCRCTPSSARRGARSAAATAPSQRCFSLSRCFTSVRRLQGSRRSCCQGRAGVMVRGVKLNYRGTANKEPLGVFLPGFLHRLGKILNRRSPQTAVEARSPLRRKVDKPPIIPQKLLCRGLCRAECQAPRSAGSRGGPARGPPASIRRVRRGQTCIPGRSPVARGGCASYL